MKRRDFLKTGLAAGTLTAAGFWNPARLQAASFHDSSLIVLFLRGGMDGLNAVVPYADPDYSILRPGLAIPAPGETGGCLNLDGFFGLFPRLKGMKSLFDSGQLAVIHACGSKNPTRSHFDAMDYMESGSATAKQFTGWLNRSLETLPDHGSIFRAFALTSQLPFSLSGPADAIALSDLGSLQLRDSARMSLYLDAVQNLYLGRDDPAASAALSSLEAIRLGKDKLDPSSYITSNGADYGVSPFGAQMRNLAQTIKADVGLQIAALDLGGWDTHTNQGNSDSGELFNALAVLDDGVSAFVQDMDSRMDHTALLIISEFGRTAAQNGSGGTDHGHGTAFFVIGGGVKGGKVYGSWPGLRSSQLHEGRDLAVTTDFRRVFGEVLSGTIGVSSFKTIFPDYTFSDDPPLFLYS